MKWRLLISVLHRIKHWSGAFLVIWFVLFSTAVNAQLNFLSVLPAPNSNSVVPNTDIQLTFDQNVEAITANASNIIVIGSQTGIISGTITGAGTPIITFNPDEDFKNGEVIRVTLTTNISNTLGQALAGPVGIQFTIETLPGPETPAYFEERVFSDVLFQPFDMVSGDIDSDGDIDVYATWAGSSTLAWYENDGNQNFTEHMVANSIGGAAGVFLADVNSDGNMDLLAASQSNFVSWYENDGAQNFTEHIVSSTANVASVVVVIDMDGDGDMDIISGGYSPVSTPAKLAWHENDGAENFTEREIVGFNIDPTEFYPIDVDGDGDMDIVVASEIQSFGPGQDKIVWLENDGTQNFTEHIVDAKQGRYSSVQAADVDGDGDVDIVAAAALNRLSWYENDGNQIFTEHEIGNMVNQPRAVFVADMDGDGDFDVLHVSELQDKIAWFENDGNQNFIEQIVYDRGPFDPDVEGAYFPWATNPSDIDMDGDLDVLVAFRFDRISWFENTIRPADVDLIIYNGVSPNNNGQNDFFKIENIETYPGNKVHIFNRWGQKIFEVEDYNNRLSTHRFEGRSNVGSENELVEGTYFYVITLPTGKLTGFLHLRR